jgi:hypothetical protein
MQNSKNCGMSTRSKLAIILAFLPLLVVRGETLITTNGEVFRFNVPTGQVALISYYYASPQPENFPLIIAKGQTNVLPFTVYDFTPQPKAALSGPLELVKTNSGNSIISYQFLSGSPIVSEVITSHSTNSINVPSGKTIKFLPPIGLESGISVSMQKGQKTIGGDLRIEGGEEFAGPLTIDLFLTKPQIYTNKAAVFSYFFTEDALVLPELKLLQGPTGNFQIGVDKSSDLTNWFPVIIHNTADEQKAFYRLRLTK